MPKITRSLLTFIALLGLLSTLTGTAMAAPAAQAKWTVMVYISGDNDLEGYVVSDIESELAFTGTTNDVQIVALVDRGPGYDTSRGDWQTTEFFHVTQGMTADLASADTEWDAHHAEELNMGDPQTLIDFVTWTKANYPADHYALYFWGHGWNWHPGWTMRDDTSNEDTLDMHEVKAALPSIGLIDMVGFDGCNMASIEVQSLWYGHATALSHSQEFVGGEGIQYDLVLAQLAANPDMSAEDVAIATSQSATSDKTWSAVVLDSRFHDLILAVDAWSEALKNGLTANRSKYNRAFGATQSFWQAPTDKDLYDMAREIDRYVSNGDIKTKSQAVMSAVDAVILDEHHANTSTYSDVHGITIHLISRASQKYSDFGYYRTLDFAQRTRWDEFLAAYAK